MFPLHHNQLQLLLSSKEFKIHVPVVEHAVRKITSFFPLSLKLSCHEFDGVIVTFNSLVEMGKTGIIYFDQIQKENFYFNMTNSNKPQPFGPK